MPITTSEDEGKTFAGQPTESQKAEDNPYYEAIMKKVVSPKIDLGQLVCHYKSLNNAYKTFYVSFLYICTYSYMYVKEESLICLFTKTYCKPVYSTT